MAWLRPARPQKLGGGLGRAWAAAALKYAAWQASSSARYADIAPLMAAKICGFTGISTSPSHVGCVLRTIGGAQGAPYTGIFPCFLAGSVSRLVLMASRASISRGRVSRGAITWSTKPRDAAI